MRVYILGAGFSAAAGLPTTSNLLKRIMDQEVEDYLTKLNMSAEHFEELFSKIDLEAYYLNKAQKDYKRLEIINKFRRKLVEGLTHLIKHQPNLNRKLYVDFVSKLQGDDVIISFNYDLVLEEVLQEKGTSYDYCFGRLNSSNKLPIIKLHGSINHFHCDSCDNIIALSIQEFQRVSDIPLCPICGGVMDRAIIPPTLIKKYAGTAMEETWPKAMHYLQQANELYFIGYRIPDADLLSHQFFLCAFINRLSPSQKVTAILGPKDINYTSIRNLYHKQGCQVTETYQYFEEWMNVDIFRH